MSHGVVPPNASTLNGDAAAGERAPLLGAGSGGRLATAGSSGREAPPGGPPAERAGSASGAGSRLRAAPLWHTPPAAAAAAAGGGYGLAGGVGVGVGVGGLAGGGRPPERAGYTALSLETPAGGGNGIGAVGGGGDDCGDGPRGAPPPPRLESLDLEVAESAVHRATRAARTHEAALGHGLLKWALALALGIACAAAAFAVNFVVENLSGFKFWATLRLLNGGWYFGAFVGASGRPTRSAHPPSSRTPALAPLALLFNHWRRTAHSPSKPLLQILL